jgi:hypothetical protein
MVPLVKVFLQQILLVVGFHNQNWTTHFLCCQINLLPGAWEHFPIPENFALSIADKWAECVTDVPPLFY